MQRQDKEQDKNIHTHDVEKGMNEASLAYTICKIKQSKIVIMQERWNTAYLLEKFAKNLTVEGEVPSKLGGGTILIMIIIKIIEVSI